MDVNPQTVLVWAQVGGQMVQIAATAFGNLKAMLAASGADEAEQNAALDKTHALYQQAIDHERQVLSGGTPAGTITGNTIIPLLLFTLLAAAPAVAQTNPCTTPSDNSVVSATSSRFFAELSDFTTTLPDGTAVSVDYQYGAWPFGANVQTTPPSQGPSTIPKTAFVAVAGFPGCYELVGGLPGLIPTQQRMVAALRSRGQPNAPNPISAWSMPSNSFSLASTPVNPTTPGQIRVRP